MMKKIMSILSIVLMLSVLSPLQALACAGCGPIFPIAETYNDDNTIVTLTYAYAKNLHQREIFLEEDGSYDIYNYNAVISDKYSFPVHHQLADSIARYSSVYPYMTDFFDNPEPSAEELKQWNALTTIEGADRIYISTYNSWLWVGLQKIYQVAKDLINEDTKEIHFDVTVKTNNVLNDNINAILNKKKLNLAVLDILSIEAGISTVSFESVNNFIPTPILYDPINVTIIDSNYIYSPDDKTPDVVAVRLDGNNPAKDKIEVKYSYGWYYFDITETGIYAIVENFEEENEDNIEAFVTRIYQNVLEREPDEDGLEHWANGLKSSKLNAADIIEEFFFSTEFLGKNIQDEPFIKINYNTFMGREVDTAGLNHWLNTLANGYSRRYVLDEMMMSPEFTNVCANYEIEVGPVAGVEGFVARMYRNVLERRYDQEGLDSWVNGLISGVENGASIIKHFFSSEEFAGNPISNTDFIKIAYSTIMNRNAEDSGLAYWAGLLDSGAATRSDVLKEFVDSEEFGIICETYDILSGEWVGFQIPIDIDIDITDDIAVIVEENEVAKDERPAEAIIVDAENQENDSTLLDENDDTDNQDNITPADEEINDDF